MTTIQRLPLLAMLSSVLVLAAGSLGAGHGRPGDATRRGLRRSPAAGPAGLAPAASMTHRRGRML